MTEGTLHLPAATLPPRPPGALRCMTKPMLVSAAPMTLGEYAEYVGQPSPPADRHGDEGVLMEAWHPPIPSNDPRHNNAIQWVPKAHFDEAFSTENALTFGQALEALRRDWTVARDSWKPDARYVRLHASSKAPYLALRKSDGTETAYWQPTQGDMLATDWAIVGDDAPPPAPAP